MNAVQNSGEDFRVRVAREKRERMRHRLQEAAIEVYSGASLASAPVVEDVIRAAEVSRGTFYKYYDSLEELLIDIGRQVAEDTLTTYRSLFAVTDRAEVNLLAGPLLSMVHAGMDPARASITARMDFIEFFSSDVNMKKILAGALIKANSEGVIRYESIDSATDFVVGVTLEAMRRMVTHQKVRASYVKSMTRMIAAGLNMSPDKADAAIDDNWNAIILNSENLSWWNADKLKIQ